MAGLRESDDLSKHDTAKFLKSLIFGDVEDVGGKEPGVLEDMDGDGEKIVGLDNPILESHPSHRRKRAESYKHLLDKPASASEYRPLLVEDGLGLQVGSSNLDAKKHMNELAVQKHPGLVGIKYSHVLGIKKRFLEIAVELDMDVLTAAFAHVYFEKLVLLGQVSKANRKCIGGTCLVLASKLNDFDSRPSLFNSMEKHLSLSSRDIILHEFWVFSMLDFELTPLEHEYFPHYICMLEASNQTNLQEYLGNTMFLSWKEAVIGSDSEPMNNG